MSNDWSVSDPLDDPDIRLAMLMKFIEMCQDGEQFGVLDLNQRQAEIDELERLHELK